MYKSSINGGNAPQKPGTGRPVVFCLYFRDGKMIEMSEGINMTILVVTDKDTYDLRHITNNHIR
jgi:hypothetical protein